MHTGEQDMTTAKQDMTTATPHAPILKAGYLSLGAAKVKSN